MANELIAFSMSNLPADFTAEMAEETEGIQLRYPRIKMPSGGGLAWEIPTDDPDHPEVTQTLRGVILHNHDVNALFDHDAGQGTPPLCSSLDGRCGVGEPGGMCAECPLNEFGSGDGGVGKACKNMRHIYMAMEGRMLPVLVVLPPTSKKSLENYLSFLYNAATPPSGVVTEISLKRETSRNGKDTYSVAVFKNAGRLDEASRASVKSARAALRAMLNKEPSLEEVKAVFNE